MIGEYSNPVLDKATEHFREQQPTYLPLNEDQQQTMDSLFPTMSVLHESARTIDGWLPDDHAAYPGHFVTFGSYYMNTTDPRTLGKWRLQVTSPDGASALKAIIDSQPGNATDYGIGVVNERVYTPATEEDHERVFSVLSLMTGSIERVQRQKSRAFWSKLGALTARFTH